MFSKYIFALTLVGWAFSLEAQFVGHPEKLKVVTYYNHAIAKQEWDSTMKLYDDKMAAFLPPSKMDMLWGQLTSLYGDYSHFDATDTATKKGHLVYETKFHFKRGVLVEQVSVNDTGKITGVWFWPLEYNSGYREPTYANQKLFYETDIEIVSGKYKMKGKITVPNHVKKAPAVILAWGSGPNGMNEEIGGCQTFKDLALGLASQGIIVLRFEKRTHKYSYDIHPKGTPTVDDEYTTDIANALKLLKTKPYVDVKNIYLLGHSQGGMLLPYLMKKIKGFAGGISMAGAARPLGVLIQEQMNYLIPDSVAALNNDSKLMKERAITQAKLSMSDTLKPITEADLLPMGFPGSYWLHINKIHPASLSNKIKKPMLFLQGESDYQVRMEDYDMFKSANKFNHNHYFKSYPKLNHLFVEGADTHLSKPTDYYTPGNIYEPVIKDIAQFIKTKSL